ncbi:MAG: tetratricopeptide repeat protein [Pseudomonadota bacterium]
MSDAQFAAYLARASRLPADLRRGGGIRIAKGRSRDRVGTQVNSAYQAYLRGEDSLAQNLYRGVLRAKPANRDALLGLGAIAMRSGETNAASRHYQEVLRLYPDDTAAQAALLQLIPDLDPVAGESELKAMLATNPEAPHLNFALGNLYAQQSRWPQAQQAYFDALRADGNNPDYAFNLAVSLDQLGQRKAAMNFYADAIEFARQRPASFSAGAALRRISDMQSETN